MLGKTKKTILTAGPSITQKEARYVTDAAINGWNQHHSDYLVNFEKKFASYVGTNHAMATSSCTGAMHLALLGLGIGPGDEVIVPEITWVATAAAVVYTGATPVFCDVDKESWTMLPDAVERLITKKTKALMPVHIYGHPCDMEPLWDLAKKHNLLILEDAAQSIGAEYRGQKTGSLGDCAGFSFQGAKAMVTGEGGMFTTSDDELLKRVRYIGDHGRDPNRALYNTSIGYKYKMSNIQAALGQAQIERVETLVDKKIRIFNWYKERLQDIDEISLNAQKNWAKNIYWMSSIVLGDAVKHSRDEFMAELKKRQIDSRPIFYPISEFPMFDTANNPNSRIVGLRGINLPSGHERTEEEIDYICAHIREALGKKLSRVSMTQPSGWLANRDRIMDTFLAAKEKPLVLPLETRGFEDWQLVSITKDS
ncbi:MAG: DegT/DnrJ/EryC1/StrS family aminotransferase, partial [Alphaproteobacteria bacterium]